MNEQQIRSIMAASACAYLRDRPLCAQPQVLTLALEMYFRVTEPIDEHSAILAGENAARECAMPLNSLAVGLLNPEDLLDW